MPRTRQSHHRRFFLADFRAHANAISLESCPPGQFVKAAAAWAVYWWPAKDATGLMGVATTAPGVTGANESTARGEDATGGVPGEFDGSTSAGLPRQAMASIAIRTEWRSCMASQSTT
jgi:hypothetical protein